MAPTFTEALTRFRDALLTFVVEELCTHLMHGLPSERRVGRWGDSGQPSNTHTAKCRREVAAELLNGSGGVAAPLIMSAHVIQSKGSSHAVELWSMAQSANTGRCTYAFLVCAAGLVSSSSEIQSKFSYLQPAFCQLPIPPSLSSADCSLLPSGIPLPVALRRHLSRTASSASLNSSTSGGRPSSASACADSGAVALPASLLLPPALHRRSRRSFSLGALTLGAPTRPGAPSATGIGLCLHPPSPPHGERCPQRYRSLL